MSWTATLRARLAGAWLRPFRNAGILALGRGARAALALLAVALATRALGPAQFGVLVLIHALIVLTSQVLRFQSWQVVLKYGAPALHDNDVARFHRVVFHAGGLDVLSALLAFAALQLLVDHVGAFAGIAAVHTDLARLYAISVVFLILDACPLGILRLLDRHDLVAWHTTIEPVIRSTGAVVLFASGGGLAGFLVVWLLGIVGSTIALFAVARYALAQRGLTLDWQRLDRGCLVPAPGIWRFSLGTNLGSTLNVGDVQVGPMLAGSVLGVSEAGLYRIAQQVANVVSKPVNKLLVPAIYTDLSTLTAAGAHGVRRTMVKRSSLLAGVMAIGVFAVVVIWGQPAIGLLFGAAFVPAYTAVVWFAFAGVLTTFTFPLVPLLISSGRVRAVVLLRGLALIAYLACFYTLVPRFGLTGAGITVNAHALVTVILSLLFVRLLLRR